nr:hypothetical protein Iba_chr03cCG3930 [Ipomoea batatas]
MWPNILSLKIGRDSCAERALCRNLASLPLRVLRPVERCSRLCQQMLQMYCCMAFVLFYSKLRSKTLLCAHEALFCFGVQIQNERNITLIECQRRIRGGARDAQPACYTADKAKSNAFNQTTPTATRRRHN